PCVQAGAMQVWIGTAGCTCPDWVGPFYPKGSVSRKMLAHYARHFPLVELNFPFYRLPAAGLLTRLVERTPNDFQFLVKLPRTLSHEESPLGLPAFTDAVEELWTPVRL